MGKSCLLLQFTDKRFQPVHDLTIGELQYSSNLPCSQSDVSCSHFFMAPLPLSLPPPSPPLSPPPPSLPLSFGPFLTLFLLLFFPLSLPPPSLPPPSLPLYPLSTLDGAHVRKHTRLSTPAQLQCSCSRAWEPGNEARPCSYLGTNV